MVAEQTSSETYTVFFAGVTAVEAEINHGDRRFARITYVQDERGVTSI